MNTAYIIQRRRVQVGIIVGINHHLECCAIDCCVTRQRKKKTNRVIKWPRTTTLNLLVVYCTSWFRLLTKVSTWKLNFINCSCSVASQISILQLLPFGYVTVQQGSNTHNIIIMIMIFMTLSIVHIQLFQSCFIRELFVLRSFLSISEIKFRPTFHDDSSFVLLSAWNQLQLGRIGDRGDISDSRRNS